VRTTADQDVFRAVADPSRRKLLNEMIAGPKTFQELHSLLPVTKGAVSQHLSILMSVGLVAVTTHENIRAYQLVPAPLEEIAEWIDGYRSFWVSRLETLEVVLRQRAASKSTAAKPVVQKPKKF
jgi:DNA-binding transcriptional ArsR family regulator